LYSQIRCLFTKQILLFSKQVNDAFIDRVTIGFASLGIGNHLLGDILTKLGGIAMPKAAAVNYPAYEE
jgi:hypothetical protein